jgi:hypothetical protein
MAVSLPTDLNFALKNTMAKARNVRINVSPIQSGAPANPTDTLKFDIPTSRRGQFLNQAGSYLQLRIRNNDSLASAKFALDGSGASVIQRMSVYSGGALLEDVQAYNLLYNAMLDSQVSMSDRLTTFSVAGGVAQPASTATENYTRGGVIIAKDASAVVNVPLISGILGNGCSKYLPIGAIANDLRLEIVLAPAVEALVSVSTTANYQVLEAVLILDVLELGDEAQGMIDQMTGGNYVISGETYRNAQTVLQGSSSQDSVLLPFRFSSIKSLLWAFRPVTAQASVLQAGMNSRFNPFDSATQGTSCSVQLRAGALYIPNAPIKYSAELFTELQKAYHRFGSQSQGSSMTWSTWSRTAPLTSLVPSNAGSTGTDFDSFYPAYARDIGSAFFGLNLDSVSGKSELLHSGINTLNQNLFLDMTYATALPSAQTRFDAFAHCDMILQIQDGVISALM